MNIKAKIILIVAICMVCVSGSLSCRNAESVPSVKIGVIAAQTGNYAGLGNLTLEGIQVMVDRMNEEGGINGIPVELVIYDDRSETTEAALIAKKLIEVDRVHVIIGGTTTHISMGVAGICNDLETPAVVIVGTALVHDELGDWVFAPMGAEQNFIIPILKYFNQNLGISKYAALIENSGYGEGGKVFLSEVSPNYDMDIVSEEYFDPTANDVSPQLAKINNSEAQGIFIWGSSPTASMAIKQAREMGIDLPIVATPPQTSPDMIESFGDYFEMEPSVTAVTLKLDVWQQLPESDPDKNMYRDFQSVFTEEYEHPPTMWNALGAQMILFIEDGLRRANLNPANLIEARGKLRDALEGTNDIKLFTGDYTMSPRDHFGQTKDRTILVTFENGEMIHLP